VAHSASILSFDKDPAKVIAPTIAAITSILQSSLSEPMIKSLSSPVLQLLAITQRQINRLVFIQPSGMRKTLKESRLQTKIGKKVTNGLSMEPAKPKLKRPFRHLDARRNQILQSIRYFHPLSLDLSFPPKG
jgi:hypothetical protein